MWPNHIHDDEMPGYVKPSPPPTSQSEQMVVERAPSVAAQLVELARRHAASSGVLDAPQRLMELFREAIVAFAQAEIEAERARCAEIVRFGAPEGPVGCNERACLLASIEEGDDPRRTRTTTGGERDE
jgi:hypothetical protein